MRWTVSNRIFPVPCGCYVTLGAKADGLVAKADILLELLYTFIPALAGGVLYTDPCSKYVCRNLTELGLDGINSVHHKIFYSGTYVGLCII